MKRRIFTGLAAAAAVTASILITSPASAAGATPELSATNTAAQSAGVTPNAKLPAAIQVDAAHHVVATLRGVGKQVYDCSAAGVWTFREPVAGLFTSRGVPAAIHGKGPFWASFDGSHVDGSGAVSPPASPPYTDLTKNVPWLRLAGAQPTQPPGVRTTGVFSNVDFIQRIDTVGGVAPIGNCTAPSTKAVDYTANYVFWAKN
jgi:Protein of unknown function (DUF3455)